MKITCEFNEISYTFNTVKGHLLSDRYKLMLSKEEKQKIANGEMDYFSLEINAIKNDLELKYEVQGIPLSLNQELQMEEVQTYIEDNLIFSKIEEKFKQALSKGPKPTWADKRAHKENL